MITPSDRRPMNGSGSATRNIGEGAAASSANQARKPEGVVLPWLMTMPLPSEAMSIGPRPNEKTHLAETHIAPEVADTPTIIENDNGNSRPAPEDVSEQSDGIAGEVDERHLPRATQLALVPGLRAMEDIPSVAQANQLDCHATLPVSAVAKIDRFAAGVYRHGSELAMPATTLGSKKGGRRIILVAGIFTASALCIWTIGWRPSPDLPTSGPQMASSAASLSVPSPPSSSGQQESVLPRAQEVEKSSARNEKSSQPIMPTQPESSSDLAVAEPIATVAQAAPRGASPVSEGEQKRVSREYQSAEISSRPIERSQPAGSSERPILAMPQPSATDAQIPSSRKATRQLGPEEIKLFITRGEQLMATGDVVAARIVLQRASESDDANAALALGAAYDPNVLARLGVVGIRADLEKARTWYQKAEALGSPDARRRLVLLNR
jgi:hypothetical protein